MPIAAKRQEESAVPQFAETLASRQRMRLILSLLLVAMVVVFYNPVAHNGFVYFDDSPYILKNASIQKGLTWPAVKWAFTTFYQANWHPLTWLSHALDCQLFGLNPTGHHYVSLLFHAANVVLLFLILEAATGGMWPSLLVAGLFALHPLNVESVAWAAERKNVLSMFFCLLAIRFYTSYARSGRIVAYLSTIFCFALGLMAKPQIITLPFALLLWDYWPLKRLLPDAPHANSEELARSRPFSRLILEKTPLFVSAAISAIVTVVAQRSANAVHSLTDISFPVRMENCIVAYARYLSYTFWPSKLAPLYPHPGNSLTAAQVIVSAVTLVLITVLVIRWRERRYLTVGWLWFLGTLIPVIGLVQVGEQGMADRYMYLPELGIFTALVWMVWSVAIERKVPKTWLAIPSVAILITLGAATYRQSGRWHDGETLWRYTLGVTQRNYMAHVNLAMVLAEQGRIEEAIPEFHAAEQFHQYPASQLLSLGAFEQNNGHLQGAIEQYKRALQSSSNPAEKAAAWDQIASACVQGRDWDGAKNAYNEALQLSPSNSAALIGTALLAQHEGDVSLAVAQLSRAASVSRTDVGLLLLAGALRQAGKTAAAEQAYSEAKKLAPDFAQAQKIADQIASSFGVRLE